MILDIIIPEIASSLPDFLFLFILFNPQILNPNPNGEIGKKKIDKILKTKPVIAIESYSFFIINLRNKSL
jgi:hypothetical protein